VPYALGNVPCAEISVIWPKDPESTIHCLQAKGIAGRNYKYSIDRVCNMIISIPLFSPPLLVAAALITLGLLVTPIYPRLSVIGIGSGSVLMGAVVLFTIPNGLEAPSLILFGITVVVGAWMVAVGLKKPAGK
jgi:hypothetical protein